MPDYEYIHREMARSGVTLSLLWLVRMFFHMTFLLKLSKGYSL